MTCEKALQHLIAFLDDELEPGLSIEIQSHLEHCPACAREAEIERLVRRALAERLQNGAFPALDEEAIGRLTGAGGARGRVGRARPWRRRLVLTGAALGAALIALAVFLPTRPGGTGFVDLVASESSAYLDRAGPVQLATGDVAALNRWLREQTALSVEVADGSASGWQLIGGRKCRLEGKPAAFALFTRDGVTATLVAVSDSSEALGHLRRTALAREVHWVGRCQGRNIVANRRGGLVYFAVSDRPTADLHALVAEPRP
jgi:anti-sigma factor (TIGR02949 family)